MEKESITISGQDVMRLTSLMSDMQEVCDKRTRGQLNLIKGFLFGRIKFENVDENGFSYRFKSINPNSRFCDCCGLLRDGSEYQECNCLRDGE